MVNGTQKMFSYLYKVEMNEQMENNMEQLLPLNWQMVSTLMMIPVQAITWLFEGDVMMIAVKLLFLFLPFMFLSIAYWLSLASIPTLLFRRERTKFIATTLINTWDGLLV